MRAMRAIDADELKDHQFHGCYTNIHIASNTDAYMLGWNDAIDAIVECAPTVEPVKRGHWEFIGGYGYQYRCSKCINCAEYKTTYCPHCGARMDGGKDNV